MSRIAVIGTGYVGLTTAGCFSHLGHEVVAADINPQRIDALSLGEVPILEPRLPELVREGLAGGRLSFIVGTAAAVENCEFAFLCVQTPQRPDGSADLSFIEAAARDIAAALPEEAVVVTKSTVPVGSTRVVERVLQRPDVRVVSNPEFLREGSAVHDFLHPDRIVIGSEDQAAAIRVSGLYKGIQAPTIVTDPATAETIKYASNAFLATKVSFVNAVAAVCEAVGADVNDVVLGMGYDHRIGFEFLRPGPGYGGSCLIGDETVLVRRGSSVTVVTLAELFDRVETLGPEGWEVLSWRPSEDGPEFLRVAKFTARPYEGDVVEIVTKMGRRVVCTPDHPFAVAGFPSRGETYVCLAGDLTDRWVPAIVSADCLGTSSDNWWRQTCPDALSIDWDLVEQVKRRPFEGLVYSLEVPDSHTFVTTGGLVTHNCFPKDTRALVHTADHHGYDFRLLAGVVEVNEQQFDRVAGKVAAVTGRGPGSLDGLTVAAWGLTFKARTDDLRDSPALEVISRLRERGATVQAFDPAVPPGREARELDGMGIEIRDDLYAACEGAEVLVVLTEWEDFRFADLDKVREVMAEPRVVDARNLLDRAALVRRGFAYDGIGRS